MRVLMTTDTIGGVWTFTKELATELLQRGCEVALVSFGRLPSLSQRRLCETLSRSYKQSFHYEFSVVALEWMENNEEVYGLGEQLMLRAAHEFDPDVLLSSQFCFGALPLNIPKVVVAHSDVLSWAEACRKSPLAPSEWLETYCSMILKGLADATTVVAPTKWMLSALGTNFPLPQDRCVIYNGRTLNIATADSSRKYQAITAGRMWDDAKNLKLLKDINSPMPIIVAGETRSDSEMWVYKTDPITLVGSQSEDEILTLFQSSALYLCTSVYEPFGLAPLEAALCGCAVIANDIPSLREVWEDDALYFRDAASLSSLLVHLNGNPEQVAQAQQRSLTRAGGFTSKRMASSYLSLFDRLLKRERNNVHAA